MKIDPITPDEVSRHNCKKIHPYVVDAINNELQKNYVGITPIIVDCKKVGEHVKYLVEKNRYAVCGLTIESLQYNTEMVEFVYKLSGWEVKYNSEEECFYFHINLNGKLTVTSNK